MVRPVAFVLQVFVAVLPVGCLSYKPGTADHGDFQLAKDAVHDGVATIAASKKTDAGLPEAQSLIDQLDTVANQVSSALAKPELDEAGAKSLRGDLIAYRDRYSELVDLVVNDGEHYAFASSPGKLVKLQESTLRLRKRIDPIDQRLGAYLTNEKDAMQRRIQGAVQFVGTALEGFDEQYNRRLEQKLAKVQGDPNATQRIKDQQSATVKAVDGWLTAVDSQLQHMIATGNITPSFLMADKLSDAIKSTYDPGETSSASLWGNLVITTAVATVEEFVPQAKSIGEDELWALRIIQESLAPKIQAYRAKHSVVAPS